MRALTHGENRGIGADGKRQGKDHGHGETSIAPQLPQSVMHILPKTLQPHTGAMTTHRLLYLLDSAELADAVRRASDGDIPAAILS